jgi:hypothetical protein
MGHGRTHASPEDQPGRLSALTTDVIARPRRPRLIPLVTPEGAFDAELVNLPRLLSRWPGVGLHHLAAFQSIVEESSFRRAAARLQYTQPTWLRATGMPS